MTATAGGPLLLSFRAKRVGMKRLAGPPRFIVVAKAIRSTPTHALTVVADGAHTGRPAAMDIIGFDLHKRESQLAIKSEDGTIKDRRIATTRPRLSEVFKDRPRAKILLEASTESEWVAQYLESLGHEVIVADPNFAAMYATRS